MTAARELRPTPDVADALDPAARRHRDLEGEGGDRRRHGDALAWLKAQRAQARLAVEADRGGDGAGEPVDRDIGQERVAADDALDIARAIRPAPELLDNPGGEPRRRIGEGVAEGLRLRPLDVSVAALAVGPLGAALDERRFLRGGRVCRIARRLEGAGDEVGMDAGEALGEKPAEAERAAGPPIAALRREPLVAEPLHQPRPEPGDGEGVHPRPARPPGEAVAGERGHDEVEGILGIAAMGAGIGEERDDLPHLGEAAGPAMGEDERQRLPVPTLAGAAAVHEMDALALDLGDELRQAVEPRLLRAPVEAV